jgi:hypothetical protein
VLDDYLDASQKAEAMQKVMRRIESEWQLNLPQVVHNAVRDAAEQAVTEDAA